MNSMAIAFVSWVTMAAPAAAQNADIAGKWDVSFAAAQGNETAVPLVLKKEGDKFVGTFSTPQGDFPVEASVKDKAVTIWFTVQRQNGPLSVTMNGAVDGDAMKGTMDVTGRGQGQWSAKRAAETSAGSAAGDARLDISGTWAFAVETAAGSGTPTMTFKQDGEKLTGHYSGQLGEAPLTGTVKGTAVEFTIDVSVDGNALHIVYAGTADKSSMKGTVKLGELGEGTFTAKKTP